MSAVKQGVQRYARQLVRFLVDIAIVLLMPAWLLHKVCELNGGHEFTAGVIASADEGLFVIDPTAKCTRCKLSLPQNVYDQLTAAYAAAAFEDEVW